MLRTLAEHLRDEGIDGVLAANKAWVSTVTDYLVNVWLPSKSNGFEFIGEDFRHDALAFGVPYPQHHNAWGGFTSHLTHYSTHIINTGKVQKMQTPKSHARRSFVYRVVNDPRNGTVLDMWPIRYFAVVMRDNRRQYFRTESEAVAVYTTAPEAWQVLELKGRTLFSKGRVVKPE